MKPKASLNKFSEFASTKSEARRKAIVRDQMSQSRGFPPWYAAFPKPVRECLLNGGKPDPILTRIEEMKTRRLNPKLEADSDLTKEALANVLEMREELIALPYTYRKAPHRSSRLDIGLVDVMVAADLLVIGSRKGVPILGALKLYTVKNPHHHLGKVGTGVLTQLLYKWLVTRGLSDGVPEVSMCLCLQAFPQRLEAGSENPSFDGLISKAAEEYARLWRVLRADEAA